MSQIPQPQATPRLVILAAVDATDISAQVVATASGLAQTLVGAELHLLNVLDVAPRDPNVVDPVFPAATELLEKARVMLEKLTTEAQKRFKGRIITHLAAGTPWREIIQFAANLHADLIVVGTHDKKGLTRLVLGSVAEQVVRRAQCPVLVARNKDYHSTAVPDIEPPCPDCLAVQRETGGARLWCDRHSGHKASSRLHYEYPQSYGLGSMLIR